MANQYPTVVPLGFNSSYADYNKAKMDRSGALRIYKGQIAIPAGTPAGAKIGIIPVRKGFYLASNASSVWSDALDTSNTVIITAGITYNPASAIAEAPAQYVASSTALRGGGNILLNQVELGQIYQVLDDAWLTFTTSGAATNQAGNLNYNILGAYDAGALQ